MAGESCTSSSVPRGVYIATVAANERLCDEHFRLRLRLASFPPSRAGQFVQVQCRPPVEQIGAREVDWPAGGLPKFTQPELVGREPLLRRPFSLAGRRGTDGQAEVEIIYRTVGVGTGWLAGVRTGAPLSVLGPLGNEFPVARAKPHAVLVGGGVGVPPMLYLAETLATAGKKTVAFCGARTKNLLPLVVDRREVSAHGKPSRCVAEFAERGADAVVSTDDGSLGFAGFVTDAFAAWRKRANLPADELVVYACGPEPMMRAAGAFCIAAGIECYLSLERHMACGMGACQSCIVKIRNDSEQGWSYKLCCADGPVFDAREILWD